MHYHGFNREMEIHIALVLRVGLIHYHIAISRQLLSLRSRVKFSEDMMRICRDGQAKILFLQERLGKCINFSSICMQ